MLKIKNNVNYKEFYKYGFTRPKFLKILIKVVKKDDIKKDIHYEIDLTTKEIKVWSLNNKTILDDTIYDLIKADLVEKVSE